MIYLEHDDRTRSAYCHLSERLVKPGEYVSQGQVIGKSEDTDTPNSLHLHFEITDGKFPNK